MTTLLPKTKLGTWSIVLIVLMPAAIFIGSLLADTLYASVHSGDTILKDIVIRPFIALTMLTGMAFGIAAFIIGMISIIRQKERAFLVYLSTVIGALLILFLIAEIFSDH